MTEEFLTALKNSEGYLFSPRGLGNDYGYYSYWFLKDGSILSVWSHPNANSYHSITGVNHALQECLRQPTIYIDKEASSLLSFFQEKGKTIKLLPDHKEEIYLDFVDLHLVDEEKIKDGLSVSTIYTYPDCTSSKLVTFQGGNYRICIYLDRECYQYMRVRK